MAINYFEEMERYQFPLSFKREFAEVLEKNNRTASSKRRTKNGVSQKTEYRRFVNLCSTMHTLREIGFQIESVSNLKEKHIHALVAHWQGLGDSIGTIDNKLSYLRSLAGWLGKKGMVGESKLYFKNPDDYKRKIIAVEDKSWSAKDIDIFAVLEKVRMLCERVAAQMELQLSFGMRVEESMCYQPLRGLEEALLKASILISKGTKGGRPRTLVLDDLVQLDVLERCSRWVTKRGAMIPEKYTLAQWRNHYYYIMKRAGITRESGLQVTSHGLRHEYINAMFEKITGNKSPVRGGEGYDPVVTEMAMQMIVERVGHWKKHKSQAYLGGVMQKLQQEKRENKIQDKLTLSIETS